MRSRPRDGAPGAPRRFGRRALPASSRSAASAVPRSGTSPEGAAFSRGALAALILVVPITPTGFAGSGPRAGWCVGRTWASVGLPRACLPVPSQWNAGHGERTCAAVAPPSRSREWGSHHVRPCPRRSGRRAALSPCPSPACGRGAAPAAGRGRHPRRLRRPAPRRRGRTTPWPGPGGRTVHSPCVRGDPGRVRVRRPVRAALPLRARRPCHHALPAHRPPIAPLCARRP